MVQKLQAKKVKPPRTYPCVPYSSPVIPLNVHLGGGKICSGGGQNPKIFSRFARIKNRASRGFFFLFAPPGLNPGYASVKHNLNILNSSQLFYSIFAEIIALIKTCEFHNCLDLRAKMFLICPEVKLRNIIARRKN